MSDDALTAQIRDELTRIMPVVSELTGLPSVWNGEFTLVLGAEFHGKKLFSCSILMDRGLADTDLRWRTLIHEALHAVSVGFSRRDYEDAAGWEEGVVEQMQRLLRPQVLARLGITVDEKTLTAHEAEHRFNKRIAALERLRHALKRRDEIRFYQELLSTPIKHRPGLMLAQCSQMSGIERADFIRVFSAENFLLKMPETRGI